MSATYPIGRPSVQVDNPNEAQHRRQIAEAVNRIMRGHINSSLFVTLTPSVTTTVVNDDRISAQTCVSLQPQTAHAAADMGSVYVVCGSGTMTFHHASNANTDRTFTIGMVG